MRKQKNWTLCQYAEYICAHCGTKKDPLTPLARCPNCGSPWIKVKLVDPRKTFTDPRQANPL